MGESKQSAVVAHLQFVNRHIRNPVILVPRFATVDAVVQAKIGPRKKDFVRTVRIHRHHIHRQTRRQIARNVLPQRLVRHRVEPGNPPNTRLVADVRKSDIQHVGIFGVNRHPLDQIVGNGRRNAGIVVDLLARNRRGRMFDFVQLRRCAAEINDRIFLSTDTNRLNPRPQTGCHLVPRETHIHRAIQVFVGAIKNHILVGQIHFVKVDEVHAIARKSGVNDVGGIARIVRSEVVHHMNRIVLITHVGDAAILLTDITIGAVAAKETLTHQGFFGDLGAVVLCA